MGARAYWSILPPLGCTGYARGSIGWAHISATSWPRSATPVARRSMRTSEPPASSFARSRQATKRILIGNGALSWYEAAGAVVAPWLNRLVLPRRSDLPVEQRE